MSRTQGPIEPTPESRQADEIYRRALALVEAGELAAALPLLEDAERRFERLTDVDFTASARFWKEQCWARQGDPRAGYLPAHVPASPEESASIQELHQWFSKFTPYRKLLIAYRHGQLARLLQAMAHGRRT